MLRGGDVHPVAGYGDGPGQVEAVEGGEEGFEADDAYDAGAERLGLATRHRVLGM